MTAILESKTHREMVLEDYEDMIALLYSARGVEGGFYDLAAAEDHAAYLRQRYPEWQFTTFKIAILGKVRSPEENTPPWEAVEEREILP